MIAGLWGLFCGSALILGALIGFYVKLPQRAIAAIMALGAGVLISAVAFELVEEAFHKSGVGATAIGLAAGALAYTLANIAVSRAGALHRKRSGFNDAESLASADSGSGAAIAAGALLDGIPESIVIGASLVEGGKIGVAVAAAVFLSNLPEGLSSAAGMRRAGHGQGYVLGMWLAIALASGLAALAGNAFLAHAGPKALAVTLAFAGGAVLAMIVDTMVPEATEKTHEFTGLIAVAGFFVAFLLSKLA